MIVNLQIIEKGGLEIINLSYDTITRDIKVLEGAFLPYAGRNIIPNHLDALTSDLKGISAKEGKK